ncbi:triggering receptor expressed on myeloid cells 1-like [Tamandua tetradactyla]|uniref:triggering receptor expressed on myeloid cells 1-like n=1 Tax=Tamandua tetradactyla TaxID=48850 RepID=UPI00405398B0
MRKFRLWALLWILFISEIQAATESTEEEYVLKEGQTLKVSCPFSVQKYLYSQKAWQRLQNGAEPLTLAFTMSTSGEPSEVQMGRYILEDIPYDAILHVQMTNLQVEDSGLYRCVIYQPPKEPFLLFYPVRLVVIKDPSHTSAPDKNPIQSLAPITMNPPSTVKAWSSFHTIPRTVTQPPIKSTGFHISTPGPTVNPTNERGVSRIFVLVLLLCGFLSKSMVFAVLFVVTQRSSGP